jgi:ribose/xylose/arabinose/galactoside ABC-type transport system permease subunit
MTELQERTVTGVRERSRPLPRLITSIGVNNLSLLFALAILIIIVFIEQPLFLSWQNLLNSLSQSIAIVGLIALGETVVVIAGGLDISVGSIASVASVNSAMVLAGGIFGGFLAGSMQVGLLFGVLAGALLGLVNGLIVTVLRVTPIIATLGTLAAYSGLAFLIAPNGKPVGVSTQQDFIWLGSGRFLEDLPIPKLGGSVWTGIPVLFVILILVGIFFHVLMRYTTFGRAVYAIGGNETAARLAGINVRRNKLLMYSLAGATAGLAGVLLTARTTSGNPINGSGFELQAITAVFLGGAATIGGSGTIMGTVLAFILVGVLNNGMNLIGIDTFYQNVALGALLISAVALNQWRQARAEHARTRLAAPVHKTVMP